MHESIATRYCGGNLCQDTINFMNDIEKEKERREKFDCYEHEWTWSGTPHGMVWCRKCDTNHNERVHGELKDMANPYYK